MKIFYKELLKMVKNNMARFIAMLLIIAIGICFVTGLGGISPKVLNSLDEYYVETNTPDIIIKSKSKTGFTNEEIDKIKSYSFVSSYQELSMVDIENELTRFYIYDFTSDVNKLSLVDGLLPSDNSEICVEQGSSNVKTRSIGDKITIYNVEFTISGIISNPLITSRQGDMHQTSEEYLDTIIYFSKDYCMFKSMIPTTDLYIKCNNVSSYFDSKYLDTVNENISLLKKDLNEDNFAYLTLNDNLSYATIKGLTDKVTIITMAFPLFFIAVVGLVCLTNISRLIDEERKNIGCLKSLGYKDSSIIFKYILFSLSCTIIGCIIGLITGVSFLPQIVYQAFNGLFFLPTMTSSINLTMGLYSSLGMLGVMLLITFIVSYKDVKEIPANLFLQKSLKPGKKILLEKISFIWKRLSFKYKSTLRNVFRFKGRFFMIVISICGSTILVMAGLGLYDISSQGIVVSGFSIDNGDTIKLIAMAIVLFAMALSILVLYNLTTMNIGERKRDIATLEVLGYVNPEVNGFIYREIFLMSLIGIIIGIPLAIVFLNIIFTMLDFGKISDINWYSYVLAFVISVIFVLIVIFITKHKIKKVDMNESLKSVE
jgi:putative ABC transport system permease protein